MYKLQRLYLLKLIQFALVFACTSLNANEYSDDEAYAGSSGNGAGAVATVHPLATKAGLDVLNNGGNAIDAAVAAALTLGVVDSQNSGIGGGNFALVHYADGRIEAIDGREMAPQAAHRDMYLRNGEIDSSLSKTGALAIAVPGSLAVYDYLIKTAGNSTLSELLLPAATLAEQGFPFSVSSSQRLQAVASAITQFPASSAIFLDADGSPWPARHHLIQKDLAQTYRAIAKQGVDYFYRGDFAKVVDQWMKENGGIVRYGDFSNYQMKLREAVISQYRGYGIVGFPPPSSGGIHVAQILNILASFELAELSEGDRYHVLVEAMKIAFADRAHFLGDTDFVPVPKGLIDPEYAKQLAQTITFDSVATDIQHGKPPGADIDLFGKHTTHISTADKWGNWVAITTTVNTSYGSKVVIPSTGVVMNNQMDDFSIKANVPNAFGLLGGEANQIEPGKRPLSSMSPTLVLKDGKPIMSLGAAGGPTIITQVVQALIGIIDLGMLPQQALAASRVHHQWQPDVTFIEKTLAEAVQLSLQKRGHKTHARNYLGATQAVMLGEDGQLVAVTEPRVIKQNQ